MADEERLIVSLEARVNDFEKRMKQAERTGTRSYTRLNSGSRSATRSMERDMTRSTGRINQALATTSSRIGAVSAAYRGLMAGAAVGAGAMAVRQATRMARSIAEIGDQAERAGVSAQVFQEWRFVAEQNRIGIDQMTDALRELNLRADEFVQTGAGPAEEAFGRLGYSADELREKLKNPSELMLEIIDRLGRMDRAAQIRIADEIFGGTAGERFVELLDEGEAGIRRTIDRAHELGTVMDDEMIAKADEVDRRFNAIANTVGFTLKSAIVSAASSLSDFIDGFRQFEDRQTESLQGRQRELMRGQVIANQQIRELENAPDTIGGIPANQDMIDAEIGRLRDQMEALAAEEDRIIAILRDRNGPSTWAPDESEWTPPVDLEPIEVSGDGNTGGGRSARASATREERDAVADLIAELEFERSMVGKTAAEKQTAAALRDAGANATDAERQAIENLIEATHRETEAFERTEAQMESLKQTSRDVLGGMFQDLRNGASGADMLANALSRVGESLIQAGMDGFIESAFAGGGQRRGGLLGGAVIPGILHDGGVAGVDGYAHARTFPASIFAGAPRYHNGGVAGLKPNEVPAVLERGERVIPAGQWDDGGQPHIADVRVYVDDNGNWQAKVEQISAGVTQAGLKANDRNFEARMKQAKGRPRRRG